MLSRSEALIVAQSWIGTPYVKGARVRGAGCDCATLLAEYLIGIGAAEREELGVYSHDWFCHATEERYMFALMKHAARTLEMVARGSARPCARRRGLRASRRSKARRPGALSRGRQPGL